MHSSLAPDNGARLCLKKKKKKCNLWEEEVEEEDWEVSSGYAKPEMPFDRPSVNVYWAAGNARVRGRGSYGRRILWLSGL